MSAGMTYRYAKQCGLRSRFGAFGAILTFALATVAGACTSGSPSDKNAEATTQRGDQAASTEVGDVLGGILVVYAAASLSGAFDVLATEFAEMHPELNVAPPVYDGSSSLVTQILEGAPVDVFASADIANMETLTGDSMTYGDPVVFATNQITVAVPADNPAEVTSLQDLVSPGVSVVLCAPEVPCGAAAENVLEAAGLEVTPVSSEQNVSAVAAKIASGQADAGLVYVTDVQASDGELVAVPTPVDAQFVNLYPIAVLTDAENPSAAEAFVAFVLSDRGQEILQRFGFGRP